MQIKEELKPCPACLTPIDCLFAISPIRGWDKKQVCERAVAAWNRRKTG
jgi:hypothetical protein